MAARATTMYLYLFRSASTLIRLIHMLTYYTYIDRDDAASISILILEYWCSHGFLIFFKQRDSPRDGPSINTYVMPLHRYLYLFLYFSRKILRRI